MARGHLLLTCLALFFNQTGCSEGSACLDRLDAEVKRLCQSGQDEDCRRVRKQQLEKVKVWNALTDDERARAEEQCAP